MQVFDPNGTAWTMGRAFSELHQATRDSFSVAAADTVFGASFTYDSLGRLRNVCIDEYGQDYDALPSTYT